MYWQPLHAVKVLTVTSDFLNYFFFGMIPCDYSNPLHRGNIATLLGSVIAAEQGNTLQDGLAAAPIRDNEPLMISKIGDKFDLQFGFTGVYVTGPGNKILLPKRKWGDYSHCDVDKLEFLVHLSFTASLVDSVSFLRVHHPKKGARNQNRRI
jgi:hypothetical protein